MFRSDQLFYYIHSPENTLVFSGNEKNRRYKNMNYFNCEGYPDPTAYEALTRIQKEAKKARYRPVVFICSPFSHGDVQKNIENARKYSRYAVISNCLPIAPHLLFPQFLNDNNPKERETALFMNKVILSKCEELWVCGKVISAGMKKEIRYARKKHMVIKYFEDI